MQDIELRTSVELTASRIERRASISAEAANQLAIELHAIVADYRQLFALRPPCDNYAPSEETDVAETICEPPSTSGLRTKTQLLTKACGWPHVS